MITRLSLDALCARIRAERLPVASHSGKVAAGGVFVAMPAPVPQDQLRSTPGGEKYLADALKAKPGVIVLEPRHLPLLESLLPPRESIVAAPVEAVRGALGTIAQAVYGTDLHCPTVVGITGTNGKTTETYLLEALFTALGRRTGVIGTVNYRWPGYEEEAPLTTPDCLTLHSMLAAMHAAGVETAFMEVSSHAIDQERIAGIRYAGALFTNLTQDHLDYHKDMEDYFAVKARLFREPAQGGLPGADKTRVSNADDAFGRRLLAEKSGAIGFGLKEAPVPGSRHLSGAILSLTREGMRLSMRFEGKTWELSSPLVGEFNALNLLGAQAMGLALGAAPADFTALERFYGVSGRLERVPGNKSINAFVDYAHTPDALINALTALRSAGFERIITVFGCGGNRDKTKRPLMGKAVADYADIAVLTSDNPRFEDPQAIMDDVMPGLANCRRVVTQVDRRKAIAEALALAGPKDALLVAGKGHESYQIVNGVKHPLSDRQILREMMS